MSWLYSIVFAGLLFSSGNDQASNRVSDLIHYGVEAVSQKQDETEKIDQTYPLNPNGRVRVSNINGSIVIEAWDRNEVRLEAMKTADSRESLAEVEIKVDARADSFSVESDYGNWRNRNKGDWGKDRKLVVDYHLWVPRGALLDEIETVNGSVTVSDFTNFTKVSAVNGTVKAANLRGTANLSTVNGEVSADFDRLESGSKITLSTVNGRVNLAIPSDSNATVRANSLNGQISNQFGLPVRKGQYVGRDLYGRLGAGDVQIKLSSVNGPLTVDRKNDGRSLSPATDLLPQKGRVPDDMDTDVDVSVDVDQMNRDIARANRDAMAAGRKAQKEAAVAMKEAQKELSKIGPVIVNIDTEKLTKAAVAIDSAEIQARVREGMERQKEALARLREANFNGALPRIEVKSNSIPVKAVPKVSIEAMGSSVKVNGWDRQEVKYVVTEFSSGRKRAPVNVQESVNGDNVGLKIVSSDQGAVNGEFFDDLNRVRVEVFVPKRSDLKIVTNGEIRLEGVSGDIDLKGADESINIRNSDGKLTVANADGTVRVIGFRGDLNAVTEDGDVFLEGDFNKLTGKAVDGTYTLSLPENSDLDLASNTEIEAQGLQLRRSGDSLWQLGKGGNRFQFEFVDGKLVLRNSSLLAGY